ncbi:MAG: hypothetical protein ACYC3I_21705, partial [Gemmataceae bacterium]
MSPTSSRCAVLVPIVRNLDPGCEEGLRELERRGYTVWRERGYATLDAARNQMANDALAQGFDELRHPPHPQPPSPPTPLPTGAR